MKPFFFKSFSENKNFFVLESPQKCGSVHASSGLWLMIGRQLCKLVFMFCDILAFMIFVIMNFSLISILMVLFQIVEKYRVFLMHQQSFISSIFLTYFM